MGHFTRFWGGLNYPQDSYTRPAIAQGEIRQDGEHGTTGSALDPPDGEAPEANPRIMGVACEAPAAATGRLVGELKAKRQHEGENTLEKRLAVSQQAEIGGFVSKIDSDGAVMPHLCGCCSQCVTPRSSGLVR